MIHLVQIAGVLLLYFFLFYAFGALTFRLIRADRTTFFQTEILGFFVYHFLFSALALPMKVTLQPLSALSAVWAAVLAAASVLFFVLCRKDWKQRWNECLTVLKGPQKYVTLALLLLVLVQLVLINYNDETYALWDQSYYLGDTAASLYTNTISQYSPYTGRILDCLNSEYLLETYQNHGAVMCQLLHIHPMIENLTVMASVVVLLYQMLFFEIGRFLFHGNRAKSTLFLFFLFLLNAFSFNLFTSAEFLFIRPAEGKTILAALVIPALLYFFMKITEKPQKKTYWLCSLFVILGSFGLNMSSIFMIPFEISAFYLPLAIRQKKCFILVRWLLLLLPCIAVAAMYLLTKETFLIYTGK